MTRVPGKRRQKKETAGGVLPEPNEDGHCRTDRLLIMVAVELVFLIAGSEFSETHDPDVATGSQLINAI